MEIPEGRNEKDMEVAEGGVLLYKLGSKVRMKKIPEFFERTQGLPIKPYSKGLFTSALAILGTGP